MRISKKLAAITAAGAVTIAASGVAFAFFTTDGTGQGSATVGTSSTVTLAGTADSTLYPGANSVVHFTVTNPSTGHQVVTTIHLASVTTDVAHSACVLSDYTMSDVASGQDFPAGGPTAVTATGLLSFANNGNQNACKDAPLTLHLTSS